MITADLVGNALCLDFVNTVNKRPDASRDRLDTIDGMRQWASTAGLPTTDDDRRAASTLAAARELREAIFRVFLAVLAGALPDAADLAVITTTYAEAVAAAQLRPDGAGFSLDWPAPGTAAQIRWPVADSAMRLLCHAPLDRIGQCPSCGWLFLDTSRNGRRRWCSMSACGARVKAARHYATRTGRPVG